MEAKSKWKDVLQARQFFNILTKTNRKTSKISDQAETSTLNHFHKKAGITTWI